MDFNGFFDDYFRNAKVNCIMIMSENGTVLHVNSSFTNNFGYSQADITGRNFSLLFNIEDQLKNKPGNELQKVSETGQSNDENYIMHKNGTPIWCTGEALLITPKDNEKYIVKDIINLQVRERVQFLLEDIDLLLERIFNYSEGLPVMILDGSLKVKKANTAFMNLFDIPNMPPEGTRLSELNNEFWNRKEVKQELRNIIIKKEFHKRPVFTLENETGKKLVTLNCKPAKESDHDKQIYVMIEEVVKGKE